MRTLQNTFLFGLFLFFRIASFCQLGVSFDVKKPKPYEERILRSEKTENTKFHAARHFIQNTFTHYNYFFNANNKLNEVLERTKLSHKDDYSELLTFYNYTLDEISQFQVELDSLVYKSQTAVVLHDLRNDWIDNMYLIWGAAYYLRKNFDSAYNMFQFINYAFAPKEKDGYYKYIGSKADGNLPTNIASKEKKSLSKQIFSKPQSRNDAFIWQIRTLLAMNQYAEASSLISQLKNDPIFPERLKKDINEVQALYFYQQSEWDSAATHLINALSNATTKNERARWEYLAAQLFEKSNRHVDAQIYFTKAISHATDPVLEIYARLSAIRANRDSSGDYIDKNIAELLKMGRRERYINYRDIIFLITAQTELNRNNQDAAEKLLHKSLSFNYGNISLRNKAFLQLADILFDKKKYRQAYSCYDSLQLGIDTSIPDPEKILARKEILRKIAVSNETILRQDSLQQLAIMPESERKVFVKKLVKQLRKLQGLKDESFRDKGGLSSSPGGAAQQDLFASAGKGEWYFYNQAARAKGSSDFKSKWGNRLNADNWRRASAISNKPGRLTGDKNTFQDASATQGSQPTELTFDALYKNIPLNEENFKNSNDSIKRALFELSTVYAEELEDCEGCIEASETLRQRFPEFEKMDEVLFFLYRCYKKNADLAKLDELEKIMTEKYRNSRYTNIVTTKGNPSILKEDPIATTFYQNVYDLFLEGNFEKAKEQKKIADSLYGSNYWSPQLLYIEAMYYAKRNEDSAAQRILSQIISLYPASPLVAKAETLVNVLNRRVIIENELANLIIEIPAADTTISKDQEEADPIIDAQKPLSKQDTSAVAKVGFEKKLSETIKTINKKSTLDSISIKATQPSIIKYDFNPLDNHYVAIRLNKVDNVFQNEVKNAFSIYNHEKYLNRQFEYSNSAITLEVKLLLIGNFSNAQEAIDYILQAKPVADTRIMPWLKSDKYSFFIISKHNLEVLKSNPSLDEYQKFYNQFWQSKF